MPYCSNCGHEISGAAVACPQCGHPGPGARPGIDLTAIGGPVANAPLAEWGTRAAAFIVDGLIIGAILLFFLLIGAVGAGRRPFAFVGLFGLAAVVYKPLMEGARGQTLGKMMMNIRVVRASDAGPIGYGEAFMRWLIGSVAGFLPFGAILNLLWPLWDQNNQTWHDKVAKTIVIKQ